LLTAFSQIYRENWEQNAEKEDLKNVQFGQERCMHKVLDKEGMVVEEIRAT
jgi:hypothetical protein